MVNFSSLDSHQQAITFVRKWVKLLSDKNTIEAFSLLDKNDEFPNKFISNFEALKNVFSNYFENNNLPQFTNPYSLNLGQEKVDIYDYVDGSGFAIDYDLPLNGEWSDFTAQFSFKKKSNFEFYAYLEDIHIL